MANGNPALNERVFEQQAAAAGFDRPPYVGAPSAPPIEVERMRLSGTMSASAILLALLCVAAWFGWQAVDVATTTNEAGKTVVQSVSIPPWLWVAWVAGFIVAIVTVFKPPIARFTGPLYAVAEGVFVGAISKIFEVQWDGIVLQAIGLTIGVFVMMLVLYATGTIRVTDKLRRGIIAATGAVCLVYLVSFIASLFGSGVPMIHDAGPVGIGFSLLVVGIASMNLLADFDLIERGVDAGAPRYMEWYAAFGLLITLIWLYLEILRLLSKLRSR